LEEINLYNLLRYYAKKWAVILSLTLVGLIAGFIYNQYIQVAMYKSDATLLVVGAGDGPQNATLINNYVELFKSRRVLESVIEQQKLGISYDDLSSRVDASSDKNTEIIKVSISDQDGKLSQNLTDGAIKSFKSEADKIYGRDNIRIIDNASLPDQPFNVRRPIVLALSASAGLILSVIGLFFIYDFNLSRGVDVALAVETSRRGVSMWGRLMGKFRAWRKKRLERRQARIDAKAQRQILKYEAQIAEYKILRNFYLYGVDGTVTAAEPPTPELIIKTKSKNNSKNSNKKQSRSKPKRHKNVTNVEAAPARGKDIR
jgi:capsular polysaccharide biosynthesis protein